jgi:hypothetical protein
LRRAASVRMMGGERKPTMTQIMLPAVFCRKDFDNILRSMSDDDAATFAATNRTTFASCFTLAAPGSVAPSEPAKPALAKTKAPASMKHEANVVRFVAEKVAASSSDIDRRMLSKSLRQNTAGSMI